MCNCHLDSEMLASSCETSCETGQASLSLQQKLGSAISALPEHSRAMWMFMAIAVVLNTRESYRKDRFFASGPYSTPLPMAPVGQVVCHLYMLSYSLALVI